ncbi:MAG: 50S ribosomal protein L22 [Gemmataceae bacterium]|nr:50S ribosomal protein L22 [Gemmataceae bacterium]
MDYTAKHRFADMGARKIRAFADLIRGKMADEALELLRFYPNRGARLLEQVLKSAMGNAEDRGSRDKDELVVVESRIDGAPMMKRFQPRARGSAFPIKRRFAHIIVTVSDMQESVAAQAAQ